LSPNLNYNEDEDDNGGGGGSSSSSSSSITCAAILLHIPMAEYERKVSLVIEETLGFYSR
jgi:hypothetical protein